MYGCRYSSEERMLGAWLAHVQQMDPDAFYLYQVPQNFAHHLMHRLAHRLAHCLAHRFAHRLAHLPCPFLAQAVHHLACYLANHPACSFVLHTLTQPAHKSWQVEPPFARSAVTSRSKRSV